MCRDCRLGPNIGKTHQNKGFDVVSLSYSPQGEDGYPKRLYDKLTGDIDSGVAEYWRGASRDKQRRPLFCAHR
jgi:hypothetical protein